MNKGFTLIELIGTVVILAVISLIAFPAIINMLNNSNNELEEQTKEFINSAALEYINDNKDSFDKNGSYTINVQTLMEGGYISSSMVCDNCDIYDDTITVTGNGQKYNLTYNEVGEGDGECPTACE